MKASPSQLKTKSDSLNIASLNLRRAVDWKILEVSSALIDTSNINCDEQNTLLNEAVTWLHPRHLSDIIEERNVDGRCGWALCSKPIETVKKAKNEVQLRISYKDKKVYEVENSSKFCCVKCMDDSCIFEAKLSDMNPLARPEAKVLPQVEAVGDLDDVLQLLNPKQKPLHKSDDKSDDSKVDASGSEYSKNRVYDSRDSSKISADTDDSSVSNPPPIYHNNHISATGSISVPKVSMPGSITVNSSNKKTAAIKTPTVAAIVSEKTNPAVLYGSYITNANKYSEDKNHIDDDHRLSTPVIPSPPKINGFRSQPNHINHSKLSSVEDTHTSPAASASPAASVRSPPSGGKVNNEREKYLNKQPAKTKKIEFTNQFSDIDGVLRSPTKVTMYNPPSPTINSAAAIPSPAAASRTPDSLSKKKKKISSLLLSNQDEWMQPVGAASYKPNNPTKIVAWTNASSDAKADDKMSATTVRMDDSGGLKAAATAKSVKKKIHVVNIREHSDNDDDGNDDDDDEDDDYSDNDNDEDDDGNSDDDDDDDDGNLLDNQLNAVRYASTDYNEFSIFLRIWAVLSDLFIRDSSVASLDNEYQQLMIDAGNETADENREVGDDKTLEIIERRRKENSDYDDDEYGSRDKTRDFFNTANMNYKAALDHYLHRGISAAETCLNIKMIYSADVLSTYEFKKNKLLATLTYPPACPSLSSTEWTFIGILLSDAVFRNNSSVTTNNISIDQDYWNQHVESVVVQLLKGYPSSERVKSADLDVLRTFFINFSSIQS